MERVADIVTPGFQVMGFAVLSVFEIANKMAGGALQ
jgi:hypothetical protein